MKKEEINKQKRIMYKAFKTEKEYAKFLEEKAKEEIAGRRKTVEYWVLTTPFKTSFIKVKKKLGAA